MRNIEPLLSICIPTYNREKFLKECLDSIVNQDGFNEEEIEIIISDNASTDNTTNLVKEFQNKYKNIRYFRNEQNIGADPNIFKVMNYGNGKYLKLLCDDDCLGNYFINNIYSIVYEKSPCLIISYREENNNFSQNNHNELFDNFDLFISYFNSKGGIKSTDLNYFGFASVFCIKKDYFHKNKNNLIKQYTLNKLINHNYEFSLIAYNNINMENIIILGFNTIIYSQKGSEISWTPNFKVMYNFQHLMTHLKRNYILSHVSKKIIYKLQFTSFVYGVKFLFLAKVKYITKKIGIYDFLKNNF